MNSCQWTHAQRQGLSLQPTFGHVPFDLFGAWENAQLTKPHWPGLLTFSKCNQRTTDNKFCYITMFSRRFWDGSNKVSSTKNVQKHRTDHTAWFLATYQKIWPRKNTNFLTSQWTCSLKCEWQYHNIICRHIQKALWSVFPKSTFWTPQWGCAESEITIWVLM